MSRTAIIFAALLLASAVGLWTWGRSAPEAWGEPTQAGGPFSGLSLEAAQARAAAEDKLVLIDFTADWCLPCKSMDRNVWARAEVQAWIDEHAVAIQVDIDRSRALAASLLGPHGVMLPTFMLRRDGRSIGRDGGYKSARQLLRWLERGRKGELSAAQKAGRMEFPDLAYFHRYDVPDTGELKPFARLAAARTALEQGRLEPALEDVAWLWAHGHKYMPGTFDMFRASILQPDLEALVAFDATGRRGVEVLRADIEAAVEAGETRLWPFSDWMVLCTVLGEEERVLAWARQRIEAEGALDLGELADRAWVAQSVFNMAVGAGRWDLAGRVHDDLMAPAEQFLTMAEMSESFRDLPLQQQALSFGLAMGMRGLARQAGGKPGSPADGVRHALAALCAAGTFAGRDAQARAVGERLLLFRDDARSRLALVEQALEAGRLLPDHVRWFAEAEAAGGSAHGRDPDRMEELERQIGALASP